jgi:hypothetical protein
VGSGVMYGSVQRLYLESSEVAHRLKRGRRRNYHYCKPLRRNAESCCEIDASL